MGLTALAINSDTLRAARKRGENLWLTAQTGILMLLVSLEQLISKEFERLLQCKDFWNRLCALGVDEAHLLDSWGLHFRKAFQQIGFMRARLPITARFIATTATLLAYDGQTERVSSFMGLDLRPSYTYILRRSNLRRDLSLVFRHLTAGLGGWSFPDLAHVVDDPRRRMTVIFCPGITTGFRLMIYFWQRIPDDADRPRRLRLYNALNWKPFNVETQRLIREDPVCQVVIATDILMVGMDFPNVDDVILLGEPKDVNELLQKIGRAGRDHTVANKPRGIVYITKKATETAKALLEGTVVQKKSGSGKKSKGVEMSQCIASLILAPCKTVEQNRLYNNPAEDYSCTCQTCQACSNNNSTSPCTCSGCFRDEIVPSTTPIEMDNTPVVDKGKAKTKKGPMISKEMRSVGVEMLKEFRWSVFELADSLGDRNFLLTPNIFLCDSSIKKLLDNFYLITSFDAMAELIHDLTYLAPYHTNLWPLILVLQSKFQQMKEEKSEKARVARNKKAANKAAEKKAALRRANVKRQSALDKEDGKEDSEEDEEEGDEDEEEAGDGEENAGDGEEDNEEDNYDKEVQ